jgi:hypothetical protein
MVTAASLREVDQLPLEMTLQLTTYQEILMIALLQSF